MNVDSAFMDKGSGLKPTNSKCLGLWLALLFMLWSSTIATSARSSELNLREAIRLAITDDPWLVGSDYRERALRSEAISARSLPDPSISLQAANFPTDNFDFGQEPMTQVSVSVGQRLPRGNSLQLAADRKRAQAGEEPFLRQDRQARVTDRVTQLWLEAFVAQESIRLIQEDRALFENLADATRASYSTAVKRSRQQEVIRAQVELVRLDDRLDTLKEALASTKANLSEWVGEQAQRPLSGFQRRGSPSPVALPMASYARAGRHPSVLALDQRIKAKKLEVDLAREKYKPEWGLSARYGHRGDDPMGRQRSDLFSIGLTLDLPVRHRKRQDQDVHAAASRVEALKTEKLLLVRELMAQSEAAMAALAHLDVRLLRYRQELLPQMADQAKAALVAYNNDEGDFAEAVRARIAQLNAKIDALNIEVRRRQIVATLTYLMGGETHTSVDALSQQAGDSVQ